MVLAFSASGSRVHTPLRPRKSAMPLSVEMPAPVRATTARLSATQPATSATATVEVHLVTVDPGPLLDALPLGGGGRRGSGSGHDL